MVSNLELLKTCGCNYSSDTLGQIKVLHLEGQILASSLTKLLTHVIPFFPFKSVYQWTTDEI